MALHSRVHADKQRTLMQLAQNADRLLLKKDPTAEAAIEDLKAALAATSPEVRKDVENALWVDYNDLAKKVIGQVD